VALLGRGQYYSEMLRRGALERVVDGLLEQSAGACLPLAPVLHLRGSGGWQHLTLNAASQEELRGSLAEARNVSRFETVDAFVCILRRADARALAEGLAVPTGEGEEGIAFAAQSLSGEARESAGLAEVRDALARLLLGPGIETGRPLKRCR
jgi:hypothetical protein